MLVQTKDGRTGRTYSKKGMIKGKVPVYIDGVKMPILCDPKDLKLLGYID